MSAEGINETWWRRLTASERTIAALAVAVIVMLLAGARILGPDPRGLGTHEQLGLAACRMWTYLHIPCPFCGMTTAWCWMVRGETLRAFATQPAGAFACIAAAAAVLPLAGAAIFGRWPRAFNRRPLSGRWWLTAAAVILAAWFYKLAAFFS